MNKYIKIALRSGCPFGVAMGIFHATQARNAFVGVLGGFIAGILFGGSMAAISAWSDRKNSAAGKPVGSDSVIQKRTITIAASKTEAMRLVTEAVKALKATYIAGKSSSDVIEANTPWSWKSFGERLTISVKQYSDIETVVEIVSRPKLGTTAVDYGKNFDNVEFVCSRVMAPTSQIQ